MMLLWGRLQAAVLTLVAVALVLFGAYSMGGRAARRAVTDKSQKRQIEAAKERSNVEDQVSRVPDDRVVERLQRTWSRD